jgi:ADP-ribose pyrophosphatase YjhB (NUDIX family)
MNESYCNNCGKQGHLYHQCKMPITSIGLITFRIYNDEIQYLMICRKDTLGYIDFMRGKYSIFNKDFILNMLKQMTIEEKTKLKTLSFDELWIGLWGTKSVSSQYKSEEVVSYEKINSLRNGITVKNEFYSLDSLIEESNNYQLWTEPEWGFPKGRRNNQEKDYNCAVREFCEETGYEFNHLNNIQNILPFEENFTGSNYKSYKHKYFLMYMHYKDTMDVSNFQKSEVSKMEWKTIDECIQCIRPYNLEKIKLISNIDKCLSRNFISYC